MKNHFYISYAGNKRNEMPGLYSHLDFTGIDTVVEPFCGSCAVSYYISTKKDGLTYILNDNNIHLKEMYDILTDEEKTQEFQTNFNNIISNIKTKDQYKEAILEDRLESWLIENKYFNLRPGLCPIGYKGKDTLKPIDFSIVPIVKFFRENNIIFLCDDAMKVYDEHKDKPNCMIILDPPYISTCNDFYLDHNMNIYEHLFKNDIKNEKAKIYLILEDIWIIRLLFQHNKILHEYAKTYETSKKKTTHLVISNT